MDRDEPTQDTAAEERARLFLRYQRMLRAFIRTLVPNVHDAEDLLQEVGVIVLKTGQERMTPLDFSRWSRGVARNVMLHYWRARRRSRETPSERFVELIDAAYARAEADSHVWRERGQALAECLSKLDAPARELLQRRYVENQPSEAIGRQTGRTAAAVRKTLERVRDALLRCIESQMEGAGLGQTPPSLS